MTRQSLITQTTTNDLLVNTGTPNKGDGDPLRNAFIKLNEIIAKADANFTELYATDTATKYHLGDDVQFIDIDPDSGTIVIQSGFDTGMPVYIKGANCSDGGVGGNVVIEAGGPGLPNDGTTGNIELAAQQTTIESNNNMWTFRDDGVLELPEGGDVVDSLGNSLLENNLPDRITNGEYSFIIGSDGTVNFDPSSVNGKGILQTAADLQFIAVDKTWTFGTNSTLTLPGTGTINNAAGTGTSFTATTISGTPGDTKEFVSGGDVDTVTTSWTATGGGISGTATITNVTVGLSATTVQFDQSFTASGPITFTNGLGVTTLELSPDGTTTWIFSAEGDLQLPEGGIVKDYIGNNIVPSNLSNFVNDLEIDANDLTGTTLNSGITNSSLTSVGTLTGLTSSGVVHITNTEDSTNADSGALQVDGGAHITKNLIAEGTIYAGIDAYSEVLTNPLMVASAPSGVEGGYSQVAILNNTAEASGDFQVMVDGYNINGPAGDTGWADIGMSGSNFSDPRYTITNPQDGYVFVSALDGGTGSGNLVLGTDSTGANNDIVFATGGFLVANEKMRLHNSDGALSINSGVIRTEGSLILDAGGGDGTVEIQPNGQVSFNASAMWNYSSGEPAAINYVPGADAYFIMVSPTKLKLRTGTGLGQKYWTFDTDGNINLPESGDIKDSTGASVLGGSNYTLPTASTSILGGVKVDGTTIVINGSGVISSTVVGAVTLKGTWDADTNTPELSSSLPAGVQLGWQYLVSVTGTRDIGDGSQTYTAGDIVMYDGVKWTDIPGAAGSVASFNNRTGAVSLTSGDVTSALGFTPYNATNPSSYITSSALSGLATETFVTTQGYITSSGNAATATKLASSVNINGVAFDGSGSITVTAAASTLSGNTLNSGVTQSSLTSVGTLTNLTVTNTISGSVSGSAGSAPAGALTGNTLAGGVTSSSLTSVGTLTDLTVTNTISGTVQDGVVTTGTYANPSWITSLDASKLSGSTLASGVTASSLTSVGTLTSLTVGGTLTRSGNISSAAWSTAGIGLKLPAATYTDTTSATTQGSSYTHVIGVPTLAFSSATSISQAVNLYIGGDPIAGTNATINAGTSYSLYVAGKSNFIGAVRFNGAIQSGGGASIMSLSNSSANVTAGTVSTAYNNGALVVTGGVGISGAVFTNSNITAAGYVAQTGLPAFRVYGVGSTTWTTTSPTNGIMTSSQFSLDYQQGGTNLAISTGIFTAPVGGLYQINIVGRAYSNAGVASQLAVIKNYDTTPFVMCMIEWAANTTVNHMGASTVARLAAGNTLVLKVLLGSVQFDSNDSWSVAFLG